MVVVSDWGPLHPQVQGGWRHEQLRRLRGGATPNLVVREMRQGVRRLLDKLHFSTSDGAVCTVACLTGRVCGTTQPSPPSTTIFELVTQIVMRLQIETDTIISARDAQALYAAIFTGLEKTKTTVKQEKHYYYYYYYFWELHNVLSAIKKKKMKKISRYDDLKIPPHPKSNRYYVQYILPCTSNC